MGTFKDAGDAALVSEEWCQDGIDAWALSPNDPDAYYALVPPDMHPTHPFDWMHLFNTVSPTKAKEVFLLSITDVAADLDAGDIKDRLNALAAETADLAAYKTWYDAGSGSDRRKERHLIGETVCFLQADTFGLLRAVRTLTGLKAALDSTTVLATEIALMDTWRSRCTVDEWKNGTT